MPTRENILANIKTTLEGITTAGGYNYDMDTVTRADGPYYELLDYSINKDGMAFVEDGETGHDLETHDGQSIAVMEVFITVAIKYAPSTLHDIDRTTQPSSVRSKIVEDVITAMMADWTRDSNASMTLLANDGPAIEPEVETTDGWVTHTFLYSVTYQYDESAP